MNAMNAMNATKALFNKIETYAPEIAWYDGITISCNALRRRLISPLFGRVHLEQGAAIMAEPPMDMFHYITHYGIRFTIYVDTNATVYSYREEIGRFVDAWRREIVAMDRPIAYLRIGFVVAGRNYLGAWLGGSWESWRSDVGNAMGDGGEQEFLQFLSDATNLSCTNVLESWDRHILQNWGEQGCFRKTRV